VRYVVSALSASGNVSESAARSADAFFLRGGIGRIEVAHQPALSAGGRHARNAAHEKAQLGEMHDVFTRAALGVDPRVTAEPFAPVVAMLVALRAMTESAGLLAYVM